MAEATPGNGMVPWDDVAGAAAAMFDIWCFGREREWAKLAWSILQSRGLTSYHNELERCAVLIRLGVLATIYREFCGCAWEERNEPMYTIWASDLELNPIRVAQLVGPDFTSDQYQDSDTLFNEALVTIARDLRDDVYVALRDGLGGEIMLFASLWATHWDPPEYLDDRDLDSLQAILKDEDELLDIMTTDVFEKGKAFEWVSQGMPDLY